MDLIGKLHMFMVGIGVDYALCGGHAIDLFLGKKTRPHKDIDVLVYWEDRDIVVQHLLNEDWDVYEPCGTAYLHKINSVSDQKRVKANIWCVKRSNRHYKFTEHEKDVYAVDFDGSEQVRLDYVEFLFNTRKDGYFLYARNHDVKMSLADAVHLTSNIPFLAPEIILLYKSNSDNPDYQLDFENATKEMSTAQLEWLRESLSIMFPNGHRWLKV